MITRYIKTLRLLFSSPREVIDSFLHNPGEYIHPFLFCIVGAGTVVLLNTLLGDFSFTPQLGEISGQSEDLRVLAEWTQIVSVRISTQLLPLAMLFLLIVSLSFGGAIFLRDEVRGFYDHLVVNSYAVGATIPVLVILIPIWQFSGQSLLDPLINNAIPGVLIAGTVLWIYQLYFHPDTFLEWIKILSAYITGYVIYGFMAGFLASVAGYMIFAMERLSELSA